MPVTRSRLRAVFMGSPEFALSSLSAVARSCELLAVVTQPDRPAGRGRKLMPPPVKVAAEALGVPVWQPTKLRDGSVASALRELAPDLAVVTAYGRILPPELLELPRYGCINLHASLLPRWRGAAPIQRAVLAGDARSGVSIMQMDEGCDTGPVFERHALEIGADETSGELFARLAELGGRVLEEFLRRFPRVPAPEAQDDHQAVHAPKLSKAEGRVDFDRPARRVHDHVRGMDPWPGASAQLELGAESPRVKLFASRVAVADQGRSEGEHEVVDRRPGVILAVGDAGWRVACADGQALWIGEVQFPGRRRAPAGAVARGAGVQVGMRFTAPEDRD